MGLDIYSVQDIVTVCASIIVFALGFQSGLMR